MAVSSATAGYRPRRVPAAVLAGLWSGRSWRATIHAVTGMVLGMPGVVLMFTLLAATLLLAPTVVGAALALGLLLVAIRAFSWLQRSRFAALLGLEIPRPHAAGRRPAPVARTLVRDLRDARTWRQLGYHLFAGVFGVLGGAVVTACWSAGLALTPAMLYGGPWYGIAPARSALLTGAGAAVLLGAPWVARTVAMVDIAVGRALLDPHTPEEFARRVAALAASRDSAVDAADTERRRIERDLHDGAQRRLTSLAMHLGIARTTFPDLPGPVQQAIAEAHEEAKLAMAELRDLVRGMHPAVLDDRGLDAALSGLAAGSPVPVHLHVDLPGRAARDVEAVAYFVVSEALTNATTHAGASRIDVHLARAADLLKVTVTDDGRGGADPAGGTGLRGLADRVRSVEGTLRVDSPAGGPTTLTAELPCG